MIAAKFSLVSSLLYLTLCSTKAQSKGNDTITKKHKYLVELHIGNARVFGDVQAKAFTLSQGIDISRSFSKWFAVDFRYTNGVAKGLNGFYSENFSKNPAWADKYASPIRKSDGSLTSGYIRNGEIVPASETDPVFYNYRTPLNSFVLSAKFSYQFPKANPLFNLWGSVGIGYLFFKTKINALDANGNPYTELFKEMAQTSTLSSAREIKKELTKRIDKSYETNAEKINTENNTASLAWGISYLFNKRFSLGVNFNINNIKSDLLDGQRWQESAIGDPILTRDFDQFYFNTIYLGYSF